jgi:precorrin-3B synthase
LAAEIANALPASQTGIAVHVSGCAKGCAHPMSAPLTIVGTEQGCGIVHDGTARARPERHIEANNLVAEISKMREPVNA